MRLICRQLRQEAQNFEKFPVFSRRSGKFAETGSQLTTCTATKSLFLFIFRKIFEPPVRFAAFRGVLEGRACWNEPEMPVMAILSRSGALFSLRAVMTVRF